MMTVDRHVAHPTWSECVVCGAWFTSDSAFDAHMDSATSRTCHDPAAVEVAGRGRLVFDEVYGAWRWQAGDVPPARRQAPSPPARTSQERVSGVGGTPV